MKGAAPIDEDVSHGAMVAAMGKWGGGRPETLCGVASKVEHTEGVRAALPKWIEKYRIPSLADAGAGDLNWIRRLNLSIPVAYYDLVPRHSSVIEFDITRQRLPDVGAILCRYVLNHLPRPRVLAALELFRRASRYLIANTFDGPYETDPSSFVHYNLEDPIYGLGAPLERVPDHKGHLAIWELQ